MNDQENQIDLDAFSTLLNETAEALIECGCSSNRVEALCTRLGMSYDVDVQVMAIPTGAWIMARHGGRSVQSMSRVKRWQTDLARLSAINELVYDIDSKSVDWQTARKQLKAISAIPPPYPSYLRVLAGAGASGGLDHLQGGSLEEVASAALLGALVLRIAQTMTSEQTRYMADFFAALFATTFTLAVASYFEAVSVHRMILSSIFILLPGLSFVNAIHELAQKNLVSGSAKLFDSLMVASSLAFGVFFAKGVYPLLEKVVPPW